VSPLSLTAGREECSRLPSFSQLRQETDSGGKGTSCPPPLQPCLYGIIGWIKIKIIVASTEAVLSRKCTYVNLAFTVIL
jgi:hypothetical protein